MTTSSDQSWLLAGARRDVQTALRDPRPAAPQAIDGVFYRPYPPVRTSYGRLCEMLRREWLGAQSSVDQIFLTTSEPGTISAWHAHGEATDRLFPAAGHILSVLYDNRANSPTRGIVQEFHLDAALPGVLIIPPCVWHGVKNVGSGPACLINAVDIAYCYETPDHWRVPADSGAIPYRF